MAHRLTPQHEKICEFCGATYLARTTRARYCDDALCHARRENEYKRKERERKKEAAS